MQKHPWHRLRKENSGMGETNPSMKEKEEDWIYAVHFVEEQEGGSRFWRGKVAMESRQIPGRLLVGSKLSREFQMKY